MATGVPISGQGFRSGLSDSRSWRLARKQTQLFDSVWVWYAGSDVFAQCAALVCWASMNDLALCCGFIWKPNDFLCTFSLPKSFKLVRSTFPS